MTGFASLKGLKIAATGDVTTYPCRVYSILLSGSAVAAAGDLILRDGSASGKILATIPVPAGTFCTPIDFSGSHIRAETKLHCSAIPALLQVGVFVDPPT